MSRRIAPKPSVVITEDEKSIRRTNTGKLIFTTFQQRTCCMLIQNDRLVFVRVISDNHGQIGAVYVAKVKNVVKNIDAYFVEISDGEICYLAMKDICEPYILNRSYDGRILEGDEILVQITRDAQKTKQASVTTKITGVEEEQLEKAMFRTVFSCIRKAPGEIELIVTAIGENAYNEIITDIKETHELLVKACVDMNIQIPVRLYQDEKLSLSAVYGLHSKMEMALGHRIWLKSGAYLVIEPTEALTVIDVNTGKFDGKRNAEETFRRINHEAAEEIALQLKLRNMSGIILVDFINMKSKEDKYMLLNYLKELVKTDPVKTVVVDMTPLGLVEITRKKINKPLWEQFRYK